MALPQDGQNANGLTKVTEIPKGKELIFIDPTTNEGGIITLEDLTTQILKNLTSQTFALDQGTKTLPAALNELNSNVKIDNIKYIDCGGYGTLAAFSIGKLLYCKFNGNNKVSEVTQQDMDCWNCNYVIHSEASFVFNKIVTG